MGALATSWSASNNVNQYRLEANNNDNSVAKEHIVMGKGILLCLNPSHETGSPHFKISDDPLSLVHLSQIIKRIGREDISRLQCLEKTPSRR
jgi:hypothetical protein